VADEGYVKIRPLPAIVRLRKLYDGLIRVGNGEAVRATLLSVADQVQAVARDRLGDHSVTGRAEASESTAIEGNRITETNIRYLRFHAWWPFRGGRMPPFILTRALKTFQKETAKLLAG